MKNINVKEEIFNTAKIIAESVIKENPPDETFKGRIVGKYNGGYIVEVLGFQYKILCSSKMGLNTSVWVTRPKGDVKNQFITEIVSSSTGDFEVSNVTSVANKTGDVLLYSSDISGLSDQLNNKVDKVSGKQLSDENYTLAEKTKLSNLENNTLTVEQSSINGNIKINSAETKVYTHPTSHSANIITEDATHRFITDTERINWNDSNDKKHTHGNKSIIDTITQILVDNWNSAFSHISDMAKHITSAERTLWNTVSDKVDKVSGKGLSTEDFSTVEKAKLSGIENNANNYTHPSTHPSTMIIGLSPIATSGSYSDLINQPTIPTKTSQLTNDSGYITSISSHNHDDRYYTESEIDTKLNGKANASHTHTKSQITDFPSIPTDTNQLNKSDVYTKMEVDNMLSNGGENERGYLIFDDISAQRENRKTDYPVSNGNYLSEVRRISDNKLLASKTDSESNGQYISTIKIYNEDGTIKETYTVKDYKSGNNYVRDVT